jgi:general secretion pathway protein G
MNKGFTLIELLTVVAIIGIITAASATILNPAGQLAKARDAERKAELQQIRSALELYRSDNGRYPITSDWVYSNAGDSWIPGLTPNYLKTVPKDPKNIGTTIWDNGSRLYAYYSASYCGLTPGASYILITYIENVNDSERGQQIRYGSCDWGSSSFLNLTSP